MTLVYVLVLISYSAMDQDVNRTKIMSYHKNSYSCLQTANNERYRGRRLQFNENYTCLQVKDSLIAVRLKRMSGSNARLVIHGSKRFFNRP